MITQQQAPYIPEVSSPTDTSNFDVDDNDLRQCDTQPPQHNPAFSGLHLPFVGFSFTVDSKLSDLGKFYGNRENNNSSSDKALTESGETVDGLAKNAYERRIARLEDEKKEMLRKLAQSNQALQKFAHGSSLPGSEDGVGQQQKGSDNLNKSESVNNNGQEVRKLQDELNQLTKRNAGKDRVTKP